MEVVNFSELRKEMNRVMDACCNNHDITVVTRQKKPPVVIMSLKEFNALEETLYLMKNPNNYAQLLKSIKHVQRGQVKPHTLIED